MFYLFFLAHLVADFMLQPYWLVQRKRYWYGLLAHGSIVLGCMALLALVKPDVLHLWPLMLGITAIHTVEDWFKVHYGHSIPGPSIVPFIIDQVVHVITIAGLLSLTLPIQAVWTFNGSLLVEVSIYLCAYLIAALATPIAVMVWLDPTFDHAALAVGARLRSMVASSLVISLTLCVGILALPATLLGLIIAIRRPASAHPLDMPVGLLTVLGVASMLGVMLTIIHV